MSEDTNWGASNDEPTPSQSELPSAYIRRKQSREIAKWFFGISILLMVISIIASVSNSSPRTSAVDEFFSSQTDTSDTSDTSDWDSSWVPSGFTAWSTDSNIAWKFASKSSYNCDNYSCISVEFISRDGCPNGLYAAINWLDANDAVVSYDNATLPSLLSMQSAKLRFDDIQEIGDSGQMAEINCR
jgi:hypothetical protein